LVAGSNSNRRLTISSGGGLDVFGRLPKNDIGGLDVVEGDTWACAVLRVHVETKVLEFMALRDRYFDLYRD